MTTVAPARAVVCGASGFIGRALIADLRAQGFAVSAIGRHGPDAAWSDRERVAALIDGAEVVVNLAGRSVGCRYNDRNRDEIYRSRVDTTAQLHAAVARADRPPRVWLNASTGTIYRDAVDRPQTEADGELGSGFSVDVARTWEEVFFAGELPGTRRVALRMAIVLGDGPALHLLARAARFGLGGPQIDGRWFPHRRYRGIGPRPTPSVAHAPRPRTGAGATQKFSWIHLDDLLAAIRFVLAHDEIAGPVNLSAPGISDNQTLMAELRRVTRAPIGIGAYRWMLEPALFVLRQESELLLKSRWVKPQVLLDAGFTFTHPDLPEALDDLIGSAAARAPRAARR